MTNPRPILVALSLTTLFACSDDPEFLPNTPDVGGDSEVVLPDIVEPDASDSGPDTPGPACDPTTCGAFVCDPGSNTCFTACTDGSECNDESQCDDSVEPAVCVEIPDDPFLYVAVVSRAGVSTPDSPNPAIDRTRNPGPDLDSIAVSAGGTLTYAAVVESAGDGAWSLEEGNTRPVGTHAVAVLVKDTVNDAGVCDLDIGSEDGTGAGYVSIGGDGGYIVVSFGRDVATGDTIVVNEVDALYCSDAATERPDAYEVFVTADAAAAARPGSSEEIRSGWCLVGPSAGNGGVSTLSFDAANCR